MQQQDIRYIINPFQRIFNIIQPNNEKLYCLLMRMISQFFNHIKLPSLSDHASDPKQQQSDTSAYSGASGYLYMIIRLQRYFSKEDRKDFEKLQKSQVLKSDHQLSKFMDREFYIQSAIEQYNMIEQEVIKKGVSKTMSFYMSEVSVWVAGMHLAYDTKNHALFKLNQKRINSCYKNIIDNGKFMIWELLYGVPGFLYAVLELQAQYQSQENQYFKTDFKQMSMNLTRMVIERGVFQYQKLSNKPVDITKKLPEDFRLVYLFHKKQYLGGAHGLGGNLNIILLSLGMNKFSSEQINKFLNILHPSVLFLLRHFINGNFSTSSTSQKTKLVHFCHGAPGITTCLARYLSMFPQKGISLGVSQIIQRSLDHIWKYGVLKKGFGLCHGISGNAYAFLSQSVADVLPDRKQEYLKKARLFALLREEQGVMKQIKNYKFQDRFVLGTSDNPYSLMLGIAGDICFAIDALQGVNRFPGFNFQI